MCEVVKYKQHYALTTQVTDKLSVKRTTWTDGDKSTAADH